MIDVKLLNKIMLKYNLQNIEGLILAHCAFVQDADHLQLIDTIIRQFPNKITKSSIQEMIDKKIIDGSRIKSLDNMNFMDIYVTEKFRESYYVDANIAGEELWAVYPNTADINGRSTILKKGEKIGDIYMDKDFLIAYYSKKIGYNKKKHEEIINKVIKANENKVINFTLRSFILDELWDSLDELIGLPNYDSRTII